MIELTGKRTETDLLGGIVMFRFSLFYNFAAQSIYKPFSVSHIVCLNYKVKKYNKFLLMPLNTPLKNKFQNSTINRYEEFR